MKVHTVMSMGDVLPPNRQTVMERLKRRFAHYRQHQNACLPRYEQAANGLYETQRQDTLLLKQRYLESKAKKAKGKSDHHRTYKEPASDASKTQPNSKSLKRSADDALSNATPETTAIEDTEKPLKIQCTETTTDKLTIKTDLSLQQANQQQPISSFSVQIAQQFSQSSLTQKSQQSIQTNIAVPKPPLQSSATQPAAVPELPGSSLEDHLPPTAAIECKQEKDIDDTELCQFKNNQASNNSVSSGGDRLSDTFPSIEFTDESGETVLHTDILLKDLIEDVFTNSADIISDFNFENSVGSLKDQEEATKDIIETLKSSPAHMRSFHSDSLAFGANANGSNQQNGMFKTMASGNDTPGSSITSNTTTAVTSSSTSYYNSVPQRLQPFNTSSLSLSNGLSMDFKLSEPSPAALTLKQLAEQHNMQNKQQQQMSNSPLSNRPQSFNQPTFASQMRSSNYMNGSNATVQNNSPKMLNNGQQIFNAFEQRMNTFQGSESSPNFPLNCDAISNNNMFNSNDVHSRNADAEAEVRALRMKLSSQQQKPPAYAAPESVTIYAGNQASGQQQHRPAGRQFQTNPGMRVQMSQVQQAQTSAQQMPQDNQDIKHQHVIMQQQQTHPSNMFSNYSTQQSVGNPPFHGSMSQSMSYSTQFPANSPMNRPPPEYKASAAIHQRNPVADNMHLVEQLNAPAQIIFGQHSKSKYAKQRPPNVTITPEGNAVSTSHDWRTNLINNQQFRGATFNPQENFGDLNQNMPVSQNIPLSPIYNQFRMPSNQIPPNRTMVRPNMVPQGHMMHQQRHRLNMTQHHPLRNPALEHQQHTSINMGNNQMNSNNMMGPLYSEHQDIDRQDGSHLSLEFLDNIESSPSDLLNFAQVMQSGTHYPNLDDILGK